MNEANLLHYIQSGDFIDYLAQSHPEYHVYVDVGHMFPHCTPLSQCDTTIDHPTCIILSRLTVSQMLELYDITNLTQIVIINLRVGVASIGHKTSPEFDDITMMTQYGWNVYEPISLSEYHTMIDTVQQPTYIRITHRYLPYELEMESHDGMRYFGELSSSVTYFPASMIETVGGLDPEQQTSQYSMISDWSRWYMSDYFREVASVGGTSIVMMEQTQQQVDDYIDVIRTLYPKHRIIGISLGQQHTQGLVIVDEYRDEQYGCDVQSVQKLLTSPVI